MHIKKPVDAIMLCIRLDDHLQVEDQQVFNQLVKIFGKEVLKKTVILLTRANTVKPMGALRHQHTDHDYLKLVRDELKEAVINSFKKQKVMVPPQLSQSCVLVGAPEMTREKRMIPDIENMDGSWIDWIPSVARVLLNVEFA